MRLVDDRALGRVGGSQPGVRLVVDDDPLRGPAGAVELAAGTPPVREGAGREHDRVAAGLADRGTLRCVGDLAGVGVEQQLVGVEVVAVGVAVGDEPGRRPRRPLRHVRPGAAPAPETVEGAVPEAGEFAAPHPVGAPGQRDGRHGVRAEGLGEELEGDAGRGGRVDGEGRRAVLRDHVGAERPRGVGPAGLVDACGGVEGGRSHTDQRDRGHRRFANRTRRLRPASRRSRVRREGSRGRPAPRRRGRTRC